MKHRELFNTADYTPGRCVSCDERLPAKGAKAGAPRVVCCGDLECRRVYWKLRRARIDELARLGLQVEARGA